MREELKNNSNKPWNQLVSSSWFACAASPVSLSAQAVEKWHPRIEQLKLLLVLGNAQKQQVIYHVGGMRKTPLSNPQTNPQQGWKRFSGCDLYKLDANVTALIIFKCPFHKPQISRDAEPRDFPPKGSQGAHTAWTCSMFLWGRRSFSAHNKSLLYTRSSGLKSHSHEFETHDCLRLLERTHGRGECSGSEDSSGKPQPTLMWDETAVAFRSVILPKSRSVTSLYYVSVLCFAEDNQGHVFSSYNQDCSTLLNRNRTKHKCLKIKAATQNRRLTTKLSVQPFQGSTVQLIVRAVRTDGCKVIMMADCCHGAPWRRDAVT